MTLSFPLSLSLFSRSESANKFHVIGGIIRLINTAKSLLLLDAAVYDRYSANESVAHRRYARYCATLITRAGKRDGCNSKARVCAARWLTVLLHYRTSQRDDAGENVAANIAALRCRDRNPRGG